MPQQTETTAIAEPATGASVVPADSGRAVETLQKQVREKDQLVAALTERLEQAAEQLDRLRRTGVDKGHRPLAGSVPTELVQDQKQTLEELRKFVGSWEEIKPGDALQRIETQVLEIRNMISAGVSIGGGATPGAASSAKTSGGDRRAPAPTTAADPGGKTSNSSWWERQKAAMLGDSVETEASPANPAPAENAEGPSASESETNPASSTCSLGETVIPDLPEPVNFEEINLEDAKQAIRDRDRVIQQLREPLLLLRTAGQLPHDLESLDHLPAALRKKVEEFEAQWQARLRQSELELALERARLARELAQTRQQQELLSKQLKQNGSPPRTAEEAGDIDDGSRRRWFRFMGKAEAGKEPTNGESK